jgi:LPS-assembly lipoprotein
MRLACAATLAAGLAGCGFQLRGEPEVGIRKLFVSASVPSQVAVEIRSALIAGPTRIGTTAAEARAPLKAHTEAPTKTVFTITTAGRVYEYQLRVAVRYELVVPGREEPVIPSTEIQTRRLITYSEAAPTAKEVEEQILYKDMQVDLARQILRHIAAMKREL